MLLKNWKVKLKFKISLRNFGSRKSKDFIKGKGKQYRHSLGISRRLPFKKKNYKKGNRPFPEDYEELLVKLPKLVPYFIVRTKRRAIINRKGKRYNYIPFFWISPSKGKIKTIFNRLRRFDRLKNYRNKLVRYYSSRTQRFLKNKQRGTVFAETFRHSRKIGKNRFNLVIISNAIVTSLTLHKQLRLTPLRRIAPRSVFRLFENLYSSAALANVLGVGFLKRASLRGLSRRSKLVRTNGNLFLIGSFLRTNVRRNPLFLTSSECKEGMSVGTTVPNFFSRRVILNKKRISKLPEAERFFFPFVKNRERAFLEKEHLQQYWISEKRGGLPITQVFDGIKHPLSNWPSKKSRGVWYAIPSERLASLFTGYFSLLNALDVPTVMLKLFHNVNKLPAPYPVELGDFTEWIIPDARPEAKRAPLRKGPDGKPSREYFRYRGPSTKNAEKFYKSSRPSRLLDNIVYPDTLHDITITRKRRQYSTLKRLFNFIDWKFFYKRTIFGKKTLSKRNVLSHSAPTEQFSFYVSLCDPSANFAAIDNRAKQTVKNYLCLNNFVYKERVDLPYGLEGAWSLNKIFFVNDALGLSSKTSRMVGSAYVRPNLLADWLGVYKNAVDTSFSKIDPVSFDDSSKFFGHPALSVVSGIHRYHNTSSRFISVYLSTLFKPRFSELLSIKHAQFGKNR